MERYHRYQRKPPPDPKVKPQSDVCHPSDTWTYCNYEYEFYRVFCKGGWAHYTKKKCVVPKHACYISHVGDIYVWAEESDLADLRVLTLAVLDIVTADLNNLSAQDSHAPAKAKTREAMDKLEEADCA